MDFLYNTFKTVMVFLALFGAIKMTNDYDFDYIIFPICIVLWVAFTFFKEEFERYEQYNQYDKGKNERYQCYWGDESWIDSGRRYKNGSNVYHYGKTSNNVGKNEYKGIYSKCKRNFKITINDKNTTEDNEK